MQSPFRILGLLGGIFSFLYKFKKKLQFVNTFCGVWSGFAMFAEVQQKGQMAYKG